jgi:hypothetical protein
VSGFSSSTNHIVEASRSALSGWPVEALGEDQEPGDGKHIIPVQIAFPSEEGFARGGHVDASARRKNDSAAGSSGKVKSQRGNAKRHQLGTAMDVAGEAAKVQARL